MSTNDSADQSLTCSVDEPNLREPQKSEKAAAKAEAYEKAKALIIRASESFASGQAEEQKAVEAEKGLAALKRKKANHYWEAGKLLSEARAVAPHGTWTRLIKESGVSVTSDHDWRLLYKHFPDPTVLEDVAITEAIDKAKAIEASIKADKPRAIEGPVRPPEQGDQLAGENGDLVQPDLDHADRREDGEADEDRSGGLRGLDGARCQGRNARPRLPDRPGRMDAHLPGSVETWARTLVAALGKGGQRHLPPVRWQDGRRAGRGRTPGA